MQYPLSELALRMGKKSSDGRLYWRDQDVAGSTAALSTWLAEKPPSDGLVELTGPMTPSIALSLLSVVHDCGFKPAVYDPKYENGTVHIPELCLQMAPAVTGSIGGALEFRATVAASDFTLVEFSIKGKFIRVSDLPSVMPPSVDPEKGVVISITGKAVVWLPATIGLAFRNYPWVAVREENQNAVVCVSRCPRHRVGMIIADDQVVPACVAARAPQRGDIWFYRVPGLKRKAPRQIGAAEPAPTRLLDEEVGPHPGIIISDRNNGDVVLVPLTSNVELHRKNAKAIKLASGTFGLDRDSLILCHKPSTVPTACLQHKVGSVGDDLLREVLQHLWATISGPGQQPMPDVSVEVTGAATPVAAQS